MGEDEGAVVVLVGMGREVTNAEETNRKATTKRRIRLAILLGNALCRAWWLSAYHNPAGNRTRRFSDEKVRALNGRNPP